MSVGVFIIDDHEVIRTGLRAVLSADPDIEVVGDAEGGEAAVAVAREGKTESPDVVTVDLRMKHLSGVQTMQTLGELWPEARFLIFSVIDDRRVALELIGQGAAGFVAKGASAEELRSAVKRVASGRTLLNVSAHDDFAGGREPDALKDLSNRERSVLIMAARGFTNREIAKKLGVSPKTVSTYRVRIGDKLGVRESSEWIDFAISALSTLDTGVPWEPAHR